MKFFFQSIVVLSFLALATETSAQVRPPGKTGGTGGSTSPPPPDDPVNRGETKTKTKTGTTTTPKLKPKSKPTPKPTPKPKPVGGSIQPAVVGLVAPKPSR
jgi:hypothetical protein